MEGQKDEEKDEREIHGDDGDGWGMDAMGMVVVNMVGAS